MWCVVAKTADLATGELKVKSCSGWRLLLARTANGVYALEDYCPHQERTFHEGELVGEEVSCPWHSVQVDLATGKVTRDMGFVGMPDVRVFPIREENGEIWVNLPPGGRPKSTDSAED